MTSCTTATLSRHAHHRARGSFADAGPQQDPVPRFRRPAAYDLLPFTAREVRVASNRFIDHIGIGVPDLRRRQGVLRQSHVGARCSRGCVRRLAEKHKGMGSGAVVDVVPSRVGRPEGEKGRPWEGRLVREGKLTRPWSSTATPRWPGATTAPRRAAEHPPPEGIRGDPRGRAARLWHHVHLRRRDYRRKGVAGVALRGALDLIAKAGGGLVEGYSPARRQEDSGLVSLQHHAQPLRASRPQLRPAQGQEHCVMRRPGGRSDDAVPSGAGRTVEEPRPHARLQ